MPKQYDFEAENIRFLIQIRIGTLLVLVPAVRVCGGTYSFCEFFKRKKHREGGWGRGTDAVQNKSLQSHRADFFFRAISEFERLKMQFP